MSNGSSGTKRFVKPPGLAGPPGFSMSGVVAAGAPGFIGGEAALDGAGNLVGKDDFEAQTEQVFRNLSAALASVGCTPRDLIKLTVFVRDMRQLPAYRKVRNRFFATTTPPAAPA